MKNAVFHFHHLSLEIHSFLLLLSFHNAEYNIYRALHRGSSNVFETTGLCYLEYVVAYFYFTSPANENIFNFCRYVCPNIKHGRLWKTGASQCFLAPQKVRTSAAECSGTFSTCTCVVFKKRSLIVSTFGSVNCHFPRTPLSLILLGFVVRAGICRASVFPFRCVGECVSFWFIQWVLSLLAFCIHRKRR